MSLDIRELAQIHASFTQAAKDVNEDELNILVELVSDLMSTTLDKKRQFRLNKLNESNDSSKTDKETK